MMGRDRKRWRRCFTSFRRRVTGSVWVNMYHAIDPAVPFGGVRMSVYGREGGTEHMEEYLDTRAIWINAD